MLSENFVSPVHFLTHYPLQSTETPTLQPHPTPPTLGLLNSFCGRENLMGNCLSHVLANLHPGWLTPDVKMTKIVMLEWRRNNPGFDTIIP